MSDSAPERVHPATPYRRQVAKRDGRVAKSQDLAASAGLLAGLLALLYSGKAFIRFLQTFATAQLGNVDNLATGSDQIVEAGFSVLGQLGASLWPLFGTIVAAAVAAQWLQGGVTLQPASLAPNFSRISPARNLAKLFSLTNFVRLAMACAKVAFIVAVVVWTCWDERHQVLTLPARSPAGIFSLLIDVCFWCCLKIAGGLFLLGLVDYAYQRWHLEQSLRMTSEELREEMRNQNGDPSIANRRHQLRRQHRAVREASAVEAADLLIADGSSLVVALAFNAHTMTAPMIVAKSQSSGAAAMLEVARRGATRIVEDKALARRLWRSASTDQEIPPECFAAVAELYRDR